MSVSKVPFLYDFNALPTNKARTCSQYDPLRCTATAPYVLVSSVGCEYLTLLHGTDRWKDDTIMTTKANTRARVLPSPCLYVSEVPSKRGFGGLFYQHSPHFNLNTRIAQPPALSGVGERPNACVVTASCPRERFLPCETLVVYSNQDENVNLSGKTGGHSCGVYRKICDI